MTVANIKHIAVKGKSHIKVNGKKLLRCVSWASVFFALLSAILWAFSSLDHPATEIMKAMEIQPTTNAFSTELASTIQALMDERQLNSHAARYAGLSALFQGISLAIKQILEE